MEIIRDVSLDAVEQVVREINNSFDEPVLKSSRLGNISVHVSRLKGGADTVQFMRNDDLKSPAFIGTTVQFSDSVVKPLLLTLLR